MWDRAKVLLRRKFIKCLYVRKEEWSHISDLIFQQVEKEQANMTQSRQKEGNDKDQCKKQCGWKWKNSRESQWIQRVIVGKDEYNWLSPTQTGKEKERKQNLLILAMK